MSQNLLEKLELLNNKNILIQGLPSSIEKQFVKLSFAKNVTPLLKTRKIDFALIFAITENQLNSIMREVLPALHQQARCWIAFPKTSSKIVSDLNKSCNWECMCTAGFERTEEVALDHVWTAMRFTKVDPARSKKSSGNPEIYLA
jgi:hypothetical protein